MPKVKDLVIAKLLSLEDLQRLARYLRVEGSDSLDAMRLAGRVDDTLKREEKEGKRQRGARR
jgi:hypothetical protein